MLDLDRILALKEKQTILAVLVSPHGVKGSPKLVPKHERKPGPDWFSPVEVTVSSTCFDLIIHTDDWNQFVVQLRKNNQFIHYKPEKPDSIFGIPVHILGEGK